MNTDIKQRIAEAIKPFWGNYIIGRDVCQLLQDCLKHIEELEETASKSCANPLWWKNENEALSKRIEEQESQLRERDERLQAVEKERDRYEEALGLAKGLIEHANPKAFENGVKDQTGTIDEGEVIAGRIYEQIKQALQKDAQ